MRSNSKFLGVQFQPESCAIAIQMVARPKTDFIISNEVFAYQNAFKRKESLLV
jgi:hypothetical protein